MDHTVTRISLSIVDHLVSPPDSILFRILRIHSNLWYIEMVSQNYGIRKSTWIHFKIFKGILIIPLEIQVV